MDIGFLSAFIGGILALLSPCAALLLPAFFASTVGTGPRLLLHGGIFYVGLIAVLVPLGLGVGALGEIFIDHRQAIIMAAAGILVVLGTLQIFGFGFDPSRLMPAGADLHTRAASATGLTKTFLLGSASGLAGFCAGPVLGAILTLAAARGDTAGAGLLLAIYGAGMVVPLLIIAVFWQQMSERVRNALRGKQFTLLGRKFHSTSVITGLLMIAVGVMFWMTNGLLTAPQLLPVEMQSWLQERTSALGNQTVDIIAILVVAAVILTFWIRRRMHSQQTVTVEEPSDDVHATTRSTS